MAEDADRHLGIVQDLLNDAGVGDDRRLVVLTCPQVQVIVGLELDLSTAIVEPGVQHVGALEHVGQQVEPIDGGQIAPVRSIEARLDVDIELHRLIEVRAVEVAILHHLDQVSVNATLVPLSREDEFHASSPLRPSPAPPGNVRPELEGPAAVRLWSTELHCGRQKPKGDLRRTGAQAPIRLIMRALAPLLLAVAILAVLWLVFYGPVPH